MKTGKKCGWWQLAIAAVIIVWFVASPHHASAQEETTEIITLGSTVKTNEHARVCWIPGIAEASLDLIEQVPFEKWHAQWIFFTVRSGLCAQGIITLRFIGVSTGKDGTWKTWTDSLGNTWTVVFCEAWLRNGKRVSAYFMSPNEISNPGRKTKREEQGA